eukprot:TRINITY_DN3512_c1_g1_i2.p1 TRINITY_DN3512_c1_g1~~TRINITY_DN3512_c1_g1_i2.p1  ORF type:complete len:179 (-),score=28.15 TRINITY_DN3512_c1_g1_i2:537-1073(-)
MSDPTGSTLQKNLKWVVVFSIELLKAILRIILLVKQRGEILCYRTVPARDMENQKESLKKFTDRLNDDKKVSTPMQVTSVTVGELMWITRPLLNLFMMYIFGTKSWKPWFISLVTDVSSRYLSLPGAKSDIEKQELHTRMVYWLFYALRSPFYDEYTINADQYLDKFSFFPFMSVLKG